MRLQNHQRQYLKALPFGNCALAAMSSIECSPCYCRIEDFEKAQADAAQERANVIEELDELKERLDVEQGAHQASEERLECVSRELEILKVELNAARQNLEKAEFDKTKVWLHSAVYRPFSDSQATTAFLYCSLLASCTISLGKCHSGMRKADSHHANFFDCIILQFCSMFCLTSN